MRASGSLWVVVVRSIAVAIAAMAAAVALLVSAANGQDGQPGSSPAVGGDPAASPDAGLRDGARVSREAVELRTADSRTYVLDDGRMLTKVFGMPVNFRDGNGDWQAVDTDLEADGDGAVGIAAAGFDLSLPQVTGEGEPARLAHGDDTLAFELIGAARSEADLDGSEATYRSVLPGVDLRYRARATGVKESIMLADATAGRELEFALRTGNLVPRIGESGGIEVVDGAGRTRFSIAAPFMRDAAGTVSRAVSYELRRSEAGWVLAIRPDREWLGDPARAFPVEVDPTVYLGPQVDCHIASATPSTSLCGDDELEVGWNGTNDSRALLRFDVAGAVPKGARVEEGYVALYATGASAVLNKPLSVYRATRDWTSQASWSSADGTTAWTAAGGDFDSRIWRTTFPGSNPTGTWSYWAIGELIQDWVDGDSANQGVVLKDRDDQQLNNRIRFASSEYYDDDRHPYLGVTWSKRTGIERQFSFVEQSLSDRMSLSVNVGNGNLVQSSNDVQIAGTGIDLGIARHFNNQGTGLQEIAGRKWRLSVGGGIALISEGGGDRMLVGPTGSRHLFHKQSNGSFSSPTAIDATLAVDGGGHKLTFHKSKQIYRFDGPGNLTAIEDRNGNEVSFDYSAVGVVDDMTDTQGREVEATYDGDGNLESLEDPTGRTWQYDYDAYDRLIEYTDPEGGETEYVYQGLDNLIEIEDPRGTVTKIDYDGDQRVTSIKRGYNRSNGAYVARTQFAYSSATSPCGGNDIGKTVVTDPRGKTTTYCYDVELRATKVVDANGNARSATYSPNSDALSSTAPGSATTDFAYDGLNNLETVDEPAGEKSELEYTNGSHPYFPTKQTSPQGTGSVFAYDTAGNTTTIGDSSSPASQVEAKLEYNGQAGGNCPDDPTTKPGTLRCAVDGKGNETLYGYDDDGNLTSVTPELPLGVTTIAYDSLSRVDFVEDGKGQTRSYAYDDLDRVVEIDYGGGNLVTFDYDANGNRVERIDSVDGTSTWAYDALNRRTDDDLPSGDTDYTWDAASNLTTLTDAGGTVTYRYDDVNRLADLAEPGGSCSSPVSLCTTFGYTNRDQRERTTYPNGVEQTVTFDSSDKPTRVKAIKASSPATTLTDFTYDYDEASPGTLKTKLRRSVTDKDGNKTTYGYDFLDRLTSAIERNSGNTIIDNRAYTYDLASNRQSQTINGSTTSYAYNAANQLCWTYAGSSGAACGSPPGGAVTYGYDANGNTTANSGGLDFDYNVRDQTTAFTAPGGSAISFGYAGAGQSERTSNGGTAQHNTLLGLSRQGTTSWTRDPGGTLISQRASGGVNHYYLSDALGSVVGLADSTGALTRTYKYDPYGVVRSTTGSTANPFQYVGQYRESQGELYKMGARYYQPGLGRWSQVDPLDQAGDLREGNRYVYVGGDPVNLIDPTGAGILDDVYDKAKAIGEDTIDFVKKNRKKIGKAVGKAAAPGCYIYRAVKDKESSVKDELSDLNECFNPYSWVK
jgi:RHS repeat-associated protein